MQNKIMIKKLVVILLTPAFLFADMGDSLFEEANNWVEAGQPENAIPLYQSLISQEVDPAKQGILLYNLAIANLNADHPLEALGIFEQLIQNQKIPPELLEKLNSDSAEALSLLDNKPIPALKTDYLDKLVSKTQEVQELLKKLPLTDPYSDAQNETMLLDKQQGIIAMKKEAEEAFLQLQSEKAYIYTLCQKEDWRRVIQEVEEGFFESALAEKALQERKHPFSEVYPHLKNSIDAWTSADRLLANLKGSQESAPSENPQTKATQTRLQKMEIEDRSLENKGAKRPETEKGIFW